MISISLTSINSLLDIMDFLMVLSILIVTTYQVMLFSKLKNKLAPKIKKIFLLFKIIQWYKFIVKYIDAILFIH